MPSNNLSKKPPMLSISRAATARPPLPVDRPRQKRCASREVSSIRKGNKTTAVTNAKTQLRLFYLMRKRMGSQIGSGALTLELSDHLTFLLSFFFHLFIDPCRCYITSKKRHKKMRSLWCQVFERCMLIFSVGELGFEILVDGEINFVFLVFWHSFWRFLVKRILYKRLCICILYFQSIFFLLYFSKSLDRIIEQNNFQNFERMRIWK